MSNNHTSAEEKKKKTTHITDLHMYADVFSVTNQPADDGLPAPKGHPSSTVGNARWLIIRFMSTGLKPDFEIE